MSLGCVTFTPTHEDGTVVEVVDDVVVVDEVDDVVARVVEVLALVDVELLVVVVGRVVVVV